MVILRHAVLLWLALASVASAQIRERERIQLPSGEVLIGRILSEDATTLVFKSDGLGTLEIPVTPDLQRTSLQAFTPTPEKSTPAPVLSTAPPRTKASKSPSLWTRKIESGFSLQQRRHSDSNYAASLRGEITREAGSDRFKAHARYIVADQNNARSADRFDVGLAFNHYLQDRFYLRSNLLYRFDRLRDFSNEFEGSLGCAYYLWKNDRIQLWAGPGLTLNYSEPDQGDSGYRWLGDVRFGLDLGLGHGLSFEHRMTYLFRFEDLNDYRLRLDEALKAHINPYATVSLRYEFDYESILPCSEGRGEHRLFSALELSY